MDLSHSLCDSLKKNPLFLVVLAFPSRRLILLEDLARDEELPLCFVCQRLVFTWSL